jgi:trigger factor
MQVTETNANGLKRELKVVIPLSEIGTRYDTRLGEVKDQIQIKGFRKGKVPVAHIKKLYGRSLMAETIEQTVQETSRKAIEERKERPAVQPSIAFSEDKDEIERVIDGKSDLAYTMKFEVLPEIKITDLATLKLDRLTADVDEEQVTKALGELAERAIKFEDEAGRAAALKDRVTIDFLGKIDGVPFDGGKGEDVPVVLGQAGFIPGFEDGMMGAKAGEERAVNATFPEAYGEKSLAGKTAVFDVKVKAVAKPVMPEMDDAFAKSLGVEDMARLKDLIKGQIGGEYANVSRMKLKRQLLDELDKTHSFELPESLVEGEFNGIWQQVNAGLKQAGKTFADEGKTEEQSKAEYRKIAERRVRLGLVIGEIGDKNKISVGQEELRTALIEQARRYPGQEKMVYEYYQKNPAALTELRAPIFEDKVVDHVVALAQTSEKKVSREELLKPLPDDMPPLAGGHAHHGHDHDHDHDPATCTDPTHNH